jgi:hypothetical protein
MTCGADWVKGWKRNRHIIAVASVCAVIVSIGSSSAAEASSTSSEIAKVSKIFAGIINATRYTRADWGYTVIDQRTGKTVLALKLSINSPHG